MPPTATENLTRFSWDGPLGLPLAVVVALALLAVFAWTLRGELRILGRRCAIFFWLLRTAALTVTMWMLLAPTSVQMERSTTRKSMAVVADVSRSMTTLDPAGTSDEVRWAIASGDAVESATAAADRALAAAGVAQWQLQSAAQSLREHRAESQVLLAIRTAQQAIQRAGDQVGAVLERRNRWDAAGDAIEAGSQYSLAERIQTTLVGPDFQAFAELVKALERGRTPSQPDWRESLPDLEHRMAGVRRSLVDLAQSVSEGEQQRLRSEQPQALAAVTGASRISRVAAFVESLNEKVLDPLRETADVHYGAFDESLTRLPTQPRPAAAIKRRSQEAGNPDAAAGLNTNLSSVFEQLNRDRLQQPLAAAVITTDMLHNDPQSPDPRELAAALQGTPVYVVPIGNTRHVRDIILQAVLTPRVAMRNDDIVIQASLQAYSCQGETCTVQLLEDGEVIQQRDVEFDAEVASRTAQFEMRMSDVGVHQYQVSILPLDDELTDENNFDEFEVNVVRSEIRVLLADEMPRWEYRYLTQLFRRTPKIECDELLFRPRLIATGGREESRGFPVTVDDWDQYDVVILGDLPTERLPAVAQESLIEYLRERGGTLVMIAGHEYMPGAYIGHPLEDVLPVRAVDPADEALEGFTFYVTQSGRDHDALMIAENAEATRLAWDFVNRNAPLTSLSNYRRPLPATRTLIGAIPRAGVDEEAAARASAFLCWQPVKRGRIVYFSGAESYRLRFLRGDQLHYRLWGQMLRWAIANDLAAGSQRVRIRMDKSRYDRNETAQIVVQLADEQGAPIPDATLEAVATRADDQRFTIPLVADEEFPGRYRGEFHQPEPGVYRIQPSGPLVDTLLDDEEQRQAATAGFTVRADLPLEMLDTRCDLALAHQIADATGGLVLPPTAVGEVIALTNLEPEVTEKVQTQPLWVQWKFLWFVFGCLLTEWVIRKWKGLS